MRQTHVDSKIPQNIVSQMREQTDFAPICQKVTDQVQKTLQ